MVGLLRTSDFGVVPRLDLVEEIESVLDEFGQGGQLGALLVNRRGWGPQISERGHVQGRGMRKPRGSPSFRPWLPSPWAALPVVRGALAPGRPLPPWADRLARTPCWLCGSICGVVVVEKLDLAMEGLEGHFRARWGWHLTHESQRCTWRRSAGKAVDPRPPCLVAQTHTTGLTHVND